MTSYGTSAPQTDLRVGMFPSIAASVDWPNDAGYKMGAAKDLKGKTFTCGRVDNESNFIQCSNTMGYNHQGKGTTSDVVIYDLVNDSATITPSYLTQSYMDTNFAYRAIRVNATGSNAMMLLVEYSSNIEGVYDDNSVFSTFQTENIKHGATQGQINSSIYTDSKMEQGRRRTIPTRRRYPR